MYIVTPDPNEKAEGRTTMSDEPEPEERRRGDRRHTDWRDGKFWLTFIGIALALMTTLWNAARDSASDDAAITKSQEANTEMIRQLRDFSLQLTAMDNKLNAITVSDSGQDKEIDFLRQQVIEHKAEMLRKLDMYEARIISLEKQRAR